VPVPQRVEELIMIETTARPLHAIAEEILADWKRPYFGAVPYIGALGRLNKITDVVFLDRGEDIVRYFLANAGRWRGPRARAIKAELKAMLGGR
jgi:hypothetical protein